MAYQKTVWKDQDVENPRTYVERDNGDGTVTLLDAFGEVTELGTPVNATNMNHIENGIEEVDNSTVHKTGNETITGVKTFQGDNRITVLQNSTVTYNTAPSSDTFTDISFRDKNGYEMGVLEHVRYANNNTAIRMVAKGADGDWSTSLTVGRRANGTVYASAPTPSAGDNSDQIATTRWVNSTGNNVVHKTGDETIAGLKTFNNNLLYKQSTQDFTTTPAQPFYTEIRNVDRNGFEIGQFRVWKDTDGANIMDLLGRYQDNSVNNWGANLGIRTYSDGRSFTYASASDVDNSIVTTISKSKSENGYFRLGNGLIIQWGKSTATSSSGYVTLPTPFASADYAVIINDVMANVPPSQGSNANLVGWGVIQSRSTTSFTAFLCNYENSSWWRWGEGRSFTWIAIGY